jgi:hypothetical protein
VRGRLLHTAGLGLYLYIWQMPGRVLTPASGAGRCIWPAGPKIEHAISSPLCVKYFLVRAPQAGSGGLGVGWWGCRSVGSGPGVASPKSRCSG